jgi:hypothetical protein
VSEELSFMADSHSSVSGSNVVAIVFTPNR